jgi:hypothetical protein
MRSLEDILLMSIFHNGELQLSIKEDNITNRVTLDPLPSNISQTKASHSYGLFRRKDRDASKEQTLAQLGICLIKIPYWWNLTAEQLFHTIRKYRPGAFKNYFFHTHSVPEFLQSDHHDEEEQVVGHKDTQSHLTGCTPLPTPTVLPNQHFVLADQMSSL